jgi:hypothetical protein
MYLTPDEHSQLLQLRELLTRSASPGITTPKGQSEKRTVSPNTRRPSAALAEEKHRQRLQQYRELKRANSSIH